MHFIQIVRFPSMAAKGTRGVMVLNGQPFLVTLELPWRMNITFESCIPVGLYHCERYISTRYKETFMILGVYERECILFHPGNFLRDTDGCICPGLSFGAIHAKALVISSRVAFERFMMALEGHDRFLLQILNVF